MMLIFFNNMDCAKYFWTCLWRCHHGTVVVRV